MLLRTTAFEASRARSLDARRDGSNTCNRSAIPSRTSDMRCRRPVSYVAAVEASLRWRSIAHATCSRTTGDGSLARLRNAATIAGAGAALPSATAMLRDQRSKPIRRIALPSVLRRKAGFVPREERRKLRGVEAVADSCEIRRCRGDCVAVPRAHELAVVAAIDAISDQRAQRFGDAAGELDRQVRDAAPRIELVRCDDRTGRARSRCMPCTYRNAH